MSQPEYTVNVPQMFVDDPAMVIHVSKVGGGTVGRGYTGRWDVAVLSDPLRFRESLDTGLPKTHDEVARLAAQFASEGLDTDESWPVHDRLSCWADGILTD